MAMKKVLRRKRWRITEKVWRGIDHVRTAKEIARDLKVTPQAVYRAAKRFGFSGELVNGHRAQPCSVNWEGLTRDEWGMTNADIARRRGVSREIVRRKRAVYAPVELRQSPRK